MALNDKVISDMTTAMKEQDKFKLSVLRMLKSSLQLESISLKKELSDNEVMSVIKRNVKQRKDSIVEYQKYNKEEEITNLEHEVEILKSYLPEELSEEEIIKRIDAKIEEIKPESMKDMGRIMKELTAEIGTVADMSNVSKIVKEKLQSM